MFTFSPLPPFLLFFISSFLSSFLSYVFPSHFPIPSSFFLSFFLVSFLPFCLSFFLSLTVCSLRDHRRCKHLAFRTRRKTEVPSAAGLRMLKIPRQRNQRLPGPEDPWKVPSTLGIDRKLDSANLLQLAFPKTRDPSFSWET